jgi:hypothetical protein
MEATPHRVSFVIGESPEKVIAERAIFDLQVKYNPLYKAVHNGAEK